MTDGIIKGTGNSRLLKSAITEATTWEQFRAALIAGTLPIDLAGINADGWQQLATALNKANLLDDVTQLLIGLSDTEATVNMALRRLVLPAGKYAVVVTVLTPGGRPLSGVTVTGITNAAGAACVTDTNGKAVGFSSTASATLAVSPNFIDTNNLSKSVTLIANAANLVTMRLTRFSTASKLFTSSGTCEFSPDVSCFNCSAIGGGGNGGSGVYNSGAYPYYASGGGGGGAGYIANKANVTPTGKITATVGATNGTSSVSMAGTSIITAAGGSNGNNGTSSGGSGGSGGATGGTGGYATSNPMGYGAYGGQSSSGFLYPPTPVGGAGGGGTACISVETNYSYIDSVGRGGSAGGGTGGYSTTPYDTPVPPTNGTSYGSGGGGGCGHYKGSYAGGAGYSGAVGFTWVYKESAA